ncbi:MAG: TMEM175 family protein [Lactimicrobium sp.]|jgi:uncharacterized membrane protein|uniref:TMEM175 family protein n=1 Tax=Lactimicrobium sp. TaxID=2563780 RepID=UPI002F35F7C9
MEKNRLEAFSDGVLAIIITIVVLTFTTPQGDQWSDLAKMMPMISAYFLSFLFVAIYWVNHHIMLKDVSRINVKVLWANNALLFVMSFIPFCTGWVGRYPLSFVPLFCYFFDMFLASVAFHIMAMFISHELGNSYHVDLRGACSLIGYLAAALLSYFVPVISYLLSTAINIWWLFPQRTGRILKL